MFAIYRWFIWIYKKEAEYYNQQLAKEKGVFPAWNESIFAKQNKNEEMQLLLLKHLPDQFQLY